MKKKKQKRQKLEKKSTIHNRLMRLWTTKVRILGHDRCAVCGRQHGSTGENGRPCYVNAHHVESRATNPRMRYDPLNGVLLCPAHHKFSRDSAHKGSIWFITWLFGRRRAQYDYIMTHREEAIDLEDRDTLSEIEERLKAPPTEDELIAVRTTEWPAPEEVRQANNRQIDKTDYYRLPCGRYLEDFIAWKGLSFAEGSALKYMWRAGLKDGEPTDKDLAKADHYIRFLARRGGVDEASVVREITAWLQEATAWDGVEKEVR